LQWLWFCIVFVIFGIVVFVFLIIFFVLLYSRNTFKETNVAEIVVAERTAHHFGADGEVLHATLVATQTEVVQRVDALLRQSAVGSVVGLQVVVARTLQVTVGYFLALRARQTVHSRLQLVSYSFLHAL
jgi:hypothetical protein